jgi:hypothetical protein
MTLLPVTAYVPLIVHRAGFIGLRGLHHIVHQTFEVVSLAILNVEFQYPMDDVAQLMILPKNQLDDARCAENVGNYFFSDAERMETIYPLRRMCDGSEGRNRRFVNRLLSKEERTLFVGKMSNG